MGMERPKFFMDVDDTGEGYLPQIRQLYGIKRKAAIHLTPNLQGKSNSCLILYSAIMLSYLRTLLR